MLFISKRRAENAENKKRVLQLHGKVIRYVTERTGDDDLVLGRGGNTSVHNGELIVLSSGNIIFRSDVAHTKVSTLMSGDGVIITGNNLEKNGMPQTITAHFVDYIK